MTTLMQCVADFGRDIGIDGLQPQADGSLQLKLEGGDLLGLQQVDDEVVLHYAQLCGFDVAERLMRAMKLSAQVRAAQAMVQVGLRETHEARWLLAVLRAPVQNFSARDMHQSIETLRNFLDSTKA